MFKVMEDVMEKSKQRSREAEMLFGSNCSNIWTNVTGQETFLQIFLLALHLQHQETEGVLQDHLQHEFSHQSQNQEDSLCGGQCKEEMEL